MPPIVHAMFVWRQAGRQAAAARRPLDLRLATCPALATFHPVGTMQSWWTKAIDALNATMQSWWLEATAALRASWEFITSDPKSFTDIIIAFFTVILAIATVQLARATNVLADDTRQRARESRIQNALSIANSLISNMRLARHGIGRDDRLSEEAGAALNECEKVASMVREGLYDLSIIEKYVGPSIAFTFKSVEPAILLLRRDNLSTALYSDLEWLATKMMPEELRQFRPERRVADAAAPGQQVQVKPVSSAPERPRGKARVMFRDPETGEESTGRGKRPKWLQARIDQGRDIEEFRVKPEDPAAGAPHKRSR
jgi:H-NS histone family